MSPSSPKRGRPRDPERVRRVLEAAAQQFTTLGYERTSVESVAAASGVSKMTVYSYFPSKEALFDACIEDRCSGLFDLFLDAELDPADPRGALERIATVFLALMRNDEVIAVTRMMFGSAGVHPEVCLAFWKQGPQPCIERVAQFLAAVDARGTLRISDPARAADQFLASFLGGAHIHVMLGLGKPTADQDAASVHANVGLFLRAHQASP
jgi:TetR/AcrR family transcriptional regulator, mexJK operon transcriptional repressor